MDPDELVDFQVSSGRKVVSQLIEDGFEIRAALWVKTAEEGIWFLYIATPLVEATGLAEAYRGLQRSLSRLQGLPLSMSDIKLIGSGNPIARQVIDIQARYPSSLATNYNGKQLGGLTIDRAYIYPRHYFETPGIRQMSRDEIIKEVLQLMNRGPGILTPSRVHLRNGEHFDGIPYQLQMGSDQSMVIQFIDESRAPARVVRVDEIASIG